MSEIPDNTDKYRDRVVSRFKGHGLAKAIEYGAALLSSQPAYKDRVLSMLPLPVAHGIRKQLFEFSEKAKKRSEQQILEKEKQEELRVSLEVVEKNRIDELHQEMVRARESDRAVLFAARLTPEERKAIATKEEATQAVGIRKSSVTKSKAMGILGCTATELDRWDGDGRLPHLFTRVLPLGKATECRFWNTELLIEAKAMVGQWRERDAIRKKFRRAGLKIVKLSKNSRANLAGGY